MARTNIEEDVFGKLSKFANRLGWSEREALGLLALFWHDSQDEGVVVADKDQILDLCRLYLDPCEEKDRVFNALIKSGFIKPTETDDGLFSIRGNKKQVGVLSAYKERTRKATEARLEKLRGSSKKELTLINESDTAEDTDVDVTSTSRPRDPIENLHESQSKAKQSKAIQSNSHTEGECEGKELSSPERMEAAFHFDFESLINLYPKHLGKGRARKLLSERIKTHQRFQEIQQAIINYRDHVEREKKEPRYQKNMDNFLEEWREWLKPETGSSTVNPKPKTTLELLKELDAREGDGGI